MINTVFYICGGRSFYSGRVGRKIGGVVSCWRNLGYQVEHICGGDIEMENPPSTGSGYGAQAYHGRWYRRNPITQVLSNSISEYRDIKHDMKMYRYIRELSSRNPPDLVWERSSRLHKAGLDLARTLSVPYVLEWKDHLVPYSSSLFRKKALEMEILKNHESSYIVVESEVLKESLVSQGVDAGKILVARNAVEPDSFNSDPSARAHIRKGWNAPDEQVLIGYLGSYAFYHDAARLVLATRILADELPLTFKVIMVGNGKEYEETRKLANEMVLDGIAIEFHDAVDKFEVPDYLSALDVAVLPGSTDIICPIKVQEYMYVGLPSIVPGYPCNAEVIDDYKDGLLFNPKDEYSLAEKIRFLIENPAERRAIGHAARTKAIKEFSWDGTWGAALKNIESDIVKKARI